MVAGVVLVLVLVFAVGLTVRVLLVVPDMRTTAPQVPSSLAERLATQAGVVVLRGAATSLFVVGIRCSPLR
ncbi:MAG: hypothetical protein ACHQNA_01510 [Acidimicrobiales bacterium]